MLHVTNGDSAGDTLRRTALGGEVLTWADVLYEGPLPAVPHERLRALRAAFLSECGWGDSRELLAGLERRELLFARALAERRHVVLWFEHDLFDQLQLVQILAHVAEADHDPARLELIGVGSFPGRPDFRGLGELGPDELESLWPLRRPVTEEQVELGVAAWAALRAPEPTALETFLARDTEALPFLAAAVRRLLEELPDADGGLARSERQALEALAAGPRTPGQLFLECQGREPAPFEGDAWFHRRVEALGGGARPLVEHAAALTITDAGRDVLAGRADRVGLLGIDRWLGGTHLRPGNVWRRDRAAGRVVAPRDG